MISYHNDMTGEERDLLAIATLNQWGVFYLSAPVSLKEQKPLELINLVEHLIQSDRPRLKLAVTAFFLVHPQEARIVRQVISSLGERPSLLLKYYYTAAVFLQRLWRSQLTGSVEFVWLPDYFSRELGLPEPTLLHGRIGLLSLEEALQKSAHLPYNYRASFDSLIRLLLSKRGSR
ncbi:MAG: hypothetical protein HYY44_03785 [Deltaproteobacteria bacterium]|nr:hypothetical protein [Deltaproteobacteria bacterium]MBI4374154.1 hypothetical protein [Deltaproteobacteria bacterium]